MALHGRIMLIIMQLSLLILAAATTTAAAQALPPQAKPGCPTHCGNLTIPYPFGMDEGCYLNDTFFINCTADGSAYLMKGNLRVTNISLDEGELQIQNYVARDCYTRSGESSNHNKPRLWVVPPYTISSTKNKFIAVGCDTNTFIEGYRGENRLVTGCISFCDTRESFDQIEDSCSGAGCCQTSIPKGLQNGTINLSSYYNHKYVWDFNPCSYALLVEETQFKFSNKSFEQLEKIEVLPLVLNWAIGDDPDGPTDPCDAAKEKEDYACKANSKCVKSTDRNGYICQCLLGYEGNPYLPGGCQDEDECLSKNLCENGVCENTPGNYTCSCKSGYRKEEDDPRKCSKYEGSKKLKISLGVLASFFVLLIVIFWIYCGMKRRKFLRLKDMYFKQNGGLLLKQHLAGYNGTVAKSKASIFTEEELKKATHNYQEKIGEGAYGTIYKGKLSDGTDVAIKKSKVNAPPAQSNQFVNELIVLSEINHRNVVRLLGCCLETPTPILVYQYVSNGTLYDHIHKKVGKDGPRPPLSLEKRLNIAAGTADALAYLHYSTSLQIIHRDVKATNILLEKDYTAKVADFGASRLVPEDQDQLSTLVQGTLGYLDPEYLQSNTLTEKSDVYSFGVVLAELLTSTQALSFQKPEAERNLANFFVCSVEEGNLGKILDAEIVSEGNFELVQKVADLTKRCLRLKGGERPSMKVVSMELEGLIEDMEKYAEKIDYKRSPKETDHLLGSPNLNAYVVDVKGEGDVGGSSSIPTGTLEYDRSMQTQVQTLKPNDAGR